jgi:hypothetical protein
MKLFLVICTLLLGAAAADHTSAKFTEAVDGFAPAQIAWPD